MGEDQLKLEKLTALARRMALANGDYPDEVVSMHKLLAVTSLGYQIIPIHSLVPLWRLYLPMAKAALEEPK